MNIEKTVIKEQYLNHYFLLILKSIVKNRD